MKVNTYMKEHKINALLLESLLAMWETNQTAVPLAKQMKPLSY